MQAFYYIAYSDAFCPEANAINCFVKFYTQDNFLKKVKCQKHSEYSVSFSFNRQKIGEKPEEQNIIFKTRYKEENYCAFNEATQHLEH